MQKENIETIERNLKLNNVMGEVHNEAVSNKNGEIEIHYDELCTTTVGLRGAKKYRVKAKATKDVLTSENIDIAKFDCEGCEYSLLSVPCDVLAKDPKYVIEYHHGYEKIKNKFERCGFKVQNLWRLNENVGGFKAELEK